MFDGVSTSDGHWLRGVFSQWHHNFFKAERGCAPFLWHRVPHSEWWVLWFGALPLKLQWFGALPLKHSPASAPCWGCSKAALLSGGCLTYATTERWELHIVTAVSGKELQKWKERGTRAQPELRKEHGKLGRVLGGNCKASLCGKGGKFSAF